jgi:alpha-L-rhamnosidase
VRRLSESMWIHWVRSPQEYFESRTPDAFTVDRAASATPSGGEAWQVSLDGVRAAALTFELTEQVVGWPYFSIEAPSGTIIELMIQEGHAVGGPALLNTSGRDVWTRFICREGLNHFECFDFESLRWLQLHIREGKGSVTVRDVGVRRRLYPWPHQPVLKTSEPALQRLFDASINTLNNSAQETIVDGMGRERQQYSGDCGPQLLGIRLAFGETRSPARFLTTFSQGQSFEGYFLDCWPGYDRLARNVQRQMGLFHFGAILDHGVEFNFDCWHHYLHTGDLSALHEPYPRLLRFANFLRTLVNRDGDGLLPVEDLGIPCVWMDYQAYGQQSGIAPLFTQRHKQCSFNLFVAAMLQKALALICRACGDNLQAQAIETLGRELQAATVQRFWSKERRTFVNNLPWVDEEKRISMCDRSLANAVLFDQCPDGDTAASLKALAECPKEMGLSYPANAGWRLWALAKGGRTDVIVKDLRERWATMVSVTLNNTIQESWKATPDTSSQWSHCALAPLYVTHQSLAGIRPTAPGFKKLEIFPQLADLETLELVAYTPEGPLHFDAKGRRGARQVSITLPAGCEGELILRQEEKPSLQRISGEVPAGHQRYRLPAGKTVSFPLTAV